MLQEIPGGDGNCRQKYGAQPPPTLRIFHLGMAKAGECVGCGNEIEDAIKNGAVKIPSWPLYFILNTGNVSRGFELTMAKSISIWMKQELRLTCYLTTSS